METSCNWHRTAIVVVCIVSAALAIVSCVFYNSTEVLNNPRPDDKSHNVTTTLLKSLENTTQPIQIMKKFVIHKPVFPHCVREHIYTVFAGILQEFHVKQTMCTDSDCQRHNLNNEMTDDDTKESSGIFVVYVVISLLLVSLVAAFLEVYRARKTQGGARARDKPELSRRCSLADLTVLRHNRRESMMRRDSVLHMSFDSATSSSNHHRVPLKLLGSNHSDIRRGSLPVAPVKPNKWQRSMSADKADETYSSETHHRIHHMIRHH